MELAAGQLIRLGNTNDILDIRHALKRFANRRADPTNATGAPVGLIAPSTPITVRSTP
ncbi:hypothetical protein KDK_06370 [Dictyobacter kobayashii]|uniref:Uncharacterized protein n=1 Tax=Dictyobacter kobayashii TaxID=2014872 RepID=A0A402ACK6_9CHLR|nr:hypothetical protein KDK_06370 [Dictyobacter kobayashii]